MNLLAVHKCKDKEVDEIVPWPLLDSPTVKSVFLDITGDSDAERMFRKCISMNQQLNTLELKTVDKNIRNLKFLTI